MLKEVGDIVQRVAVTEDIWCQIYRWQMRPEKSWPLVGNPWSMHPPQRYFATSNRYYSLIRDKPKAKS